MIYYYLPFLCFFVASIKVINIKGSKPIISLLLWTIFLYYLCFVGLRGEGVGTDYYEYEGIFHNPSFIEPGFRVLITVIKIFTNNFNAFLFIIILITLLLRKFLINSFSYNHAISYLVLSGFWLLVYDLNGIRQALSLGIVGVAGYYTYHQNLKKFLLCCILASMIHYSSIIFFPFYFLFNADIKRKRMIWIIAIAYMLALLNISDYIMGLIINSGFGNVFVDKVNNYSTNNVYNSNVLLTFSTFHRIFIFFTIFFTVKYIPADDRLRKLLLLAAFLNIFVFLLLSRYELIAIRGSLPFRYFEIIYFSYLPYVFKNKQMKLLVCVLLLIYVYMQVFQTLNVGVGNDVDNTLLPYRTIFG